MGNPSIVLGLRVGLRCNDELPLQERFESDITSVCLQTRKSSCSYFVFTNGKRRYPQMRSKLPFSHSFTVEKSTVREGPPSLVEPQESTFSTREGGSSFDLGFELLMKAILFNLIGIQHKSSVYYVFIIACLMRILELILVKGITKLQIC